MEICDLFNNFWQDVCIACELKNNQLIHWLISFINLLIPTYYNLGPSSHVYLQIKAF